MRKINVSQLKISDRDLEDNLYKTHVEVVQSLRDVCEPESKGISISALDRFDVFQGTVEGFISARGSKLQAAVREQRAYDFGVVKNADVIRWAKVAQSDPIVDVLRGDNSIAFIATHPEEIPFAGSTSVYLLERDKTDRLQMTELMYIKESQNFLIYATLLAKLPFGDSREVEVIAWTDGPSGETVNSTLEPSLMGAAFLREAGAGTVS